MMVGLNVRWVGRTLLLVTLVVMVACSSDTGGVVGAGGASGLERSSSPEVEGMRTGASALADAPAKPSAGDAMSPGLRAAYIASVQQGAGAAYRFEARGGDRAAATNAAQGLKLRRQR